MVAIGMPNGLCAVAGDDGNECSAAGSCCCCCCCSGADAGASHALLAVGYNNEGDDNDDDGNGNDDDDSGSCCTIALCESAVAVLGVSEADCEKDKFGKKTEGKTGIKLHKGKILFEKTESILVSVVGVGVVASTLISSSWSCSPITAAFVNDDAAADTSLIT